MRIEECGADFLKISLLQEGTIDKTSFEKIKYLDCILPFDYDESKEENRIVYQIGNYITVKEYLNVKVLNFTEAKDFFLAWIMAFESVQQSGGKCSNLVTDTERVYIDPITRQLRFLYLPVLIEVNPDNFKEALKNLLFSVHVKNAEALLGLIVEIIEEYNGEGADVYRKLKEAVYKAEKNVKVVEKKVEVERIVEKIIEKPQKQKKNIGKNLVVYTILCTFSMVILPLLLSNVIDSSLLAKPHLMNVLLCLLTILIADLYIVRMDKKGVDNKMIITMEPQKNSEEKH